MARLPFRQIQVGLDDARKDAAEVLERGVGRSRDLTERAEKRDGELLQARLTTIRSLEDEIVARQKRIEASSVLMAELMAATSEHLVAHAHAADFSPPPWPDGIGRFVEVKLRETRETRETREMTFRLADDRSRDT